MFSPGRIANVRRPHKFEALMPEVAWGGDGRYLYILCPNGYTTASPTTQYLACFDTGNDDALVTSIALTAGKNFAACHYDGYVKKAYVMGLNWIDVIDCDPDSGTWNTVVSTAVINLSQGFATNSSFLPYPLQFFPVNGGLVNAPGFNRAPYFTSYDGRYVAADFQLGGHTITRNMYYYHKSQIIASNKLMVRVKLGWGNFKNLPYYFETEPNYGGFMDLQATDFPVIKFGNFHIAIDGINGYGRLNSSIASPIPLSIQILTLATSTRSFQEYCPNAPNRLFVTSQITNNVISVIKMDFNNKVLTDLGDIDRTSYKRTNESGAMDLLYGEYSGRMYCIANNNSNVTGVDGFHVYDPTQAVLNDCYIRTVATPYEMKSEARISTTSKNIAFFNRTRKYEYPNVYL